MSKTNLLKRYRDKRGFNRSDEPRSGQKKAGDASIFVIHKHDASTLHYDFRLEMNGVLKSWAVPKGLSTDPDNKQLAIETENHPLDYADFEGTIPAGEYGAGTVQVWDSGSYSNLKTDTEGNEETSIQDAYENGHITVWLEGKKLRGGYSLTRFREENGKAQWLLVKMVDAAADRRRNPVNTENRSVISGKTIVQIAREADDD